MSLPKDLPELVQAEVISQETADRIQEYYKGKQSASSNRLFVVFGVLGATLVGLGIILIIAHNWDDLSRSIKTSLAFLPLLIGQVLCAYTLLKKRDSLSWRESSSVFLFFAVGASISLVSQIYNIEGDLSSYLITWMLLGGPLMYVMRSSITSLLYWVGITAYAVEYSYWSFPNPASYLYWLLLAAALPYYYLLYKKKPKSNFMIFHNWIIPVSLIITLGTLADKADEFMFIAYFSLYGIFYLIGSSDFFQGQKPRNSGYKFLGSLGSITLLLTLSFDWFWEDLRRNAFLWNEAFTSPEIIASIVLTALATFLYVLQNRSKQLSEVKPMALVYMLFILIFILGAFTPYAVILINLIVLGIGILTIKDGAKQDHLGILNYGLFMITALVVCRFFDTDLSFVARGLMFVSVGIGFFVANYALLKKRKANES